MTDGERDLLVATAKILRTQMEAKLARRAIKKQELSDDLALLKGALAPFDNDTPVAQPPEGAPV
jgi:hypothetical protein